MKKGNIFFTSKLFLGQNRQKTRATTIDYLSMEKKLSAKKTNPQAYYNNCVKRSNIYFFTSYIKDFSKQSIF